VDGLTLFERPPQAVLFDWDNTLVDNFGCIQVSLNTALAAFNKPPWSLEETRARLKLSPRDALPRLFGENWKEARDIFYAAFEERHLDHLKPLQGAEALLRALTDSGIYLAVVSNKTGPFLRREADWLGWSNYFGRVVGSSDAVADKPDPAPVLLALEPAGIQPGSEVWFIGDTDIDMQCARNANCIPILINNGAMDEEERARNAPALCLSTCEELAALVRERFRPISARN
jgi:phosphoglycolate phosphatase